MSDSHNRLAELRLEHGESQKELSKKVNISDSVLSRIESGDRPLKDSELKLLADYYDVSVDYLLMRTNVRQLRNSFAHGHAGDFTFNKNKIVSVPVLGKIVAGIKTDAIENIEDYEEIVIPSSADIKEYFCLRVNGDSMTPLIFDGDVVVCKKQSSVENNEIAAVIINGHEATLKRIKRSEKGITLMPSNPAYEASFYDNEEIIDLPVEIIGKVIESRRKF